MLEGEARAEEEAQADGQLAAIAETVGIARRLDRPLWLRGGWAMDFALGRVTRPHVDVDWFVWADDLPAFADALVLRGWHDQAESVAAQQIDVERDGVEMQFAPLAWADGRIVVGGGPWAGEPWPERMLDDAIEGRLGDIRCAVISLAAQVEIKEMMPVWVPGRPRRPKDAADVAALTEQIRGEAAT